MSQPFAARHRLAMWAWTLAVAMSGACISSPTAPGGTPDTTESQPLGTTGDLQLKGHVVTTLTGAPVSGASLQLAGAPPSTTDASGAFEIAWQSPVRGQLTISGGGFVSRGVWSQQAMQPGVTIDVISLASPFNLETYRKLVFNGFDGPPSSLLRWTTEPRFYIKTTVEGALPNLCNCTRLTADDVAAMTTVIHSVVPEFTGGRYPSVGVDSGPNEPADSANTIVIHMSSNLGPGIGGLARVGANPGRIDLLVSDPGFCGYNFHPWSLRHEVGHALGFWHHDNDGIMVARAGTCASEPSIVERHLAAIAYTRPLRTEYPDSAPQSSSLLQTLSRPPVTVVN